MKERDINLDLMRCLGILVIMVAHANPPGWLFQLRNFGTPLLIVTSALTYSTIYRSRSIEIKPFLIKRLKRIVLPAWIFLVFFYPVLYIITRLAKTDFPFTVKDIILSFPLYSGFVWIFKVYVILALITPFALYFRREVKSNFVYFVIVLLLYFVYECILYFTLPLVPDHMAKFLNTVVFVIIPYAVLYLYGFKLGELSKKNIIVISITFLFIFLALAVFYYKQNGSFVQTQLFKFPPRIYYLSYAFIAIHVIYLFCRKVTPYINSKLIIWLSSKSLWIYLWHIMAYYLWYMIAGNYQENLTISTLGTLFLLGFSIMMTYIQTSMVNKYLANSNNGFIKQLSSLLT